MKLLFVFLLCFYTSLGNKNPNFSPNHSVIVHLFEWKWKDIAEECESVLGPVGYGGVQVSPVNENLIVRNEVYKRPWWERYQPMSYKIQTRSGNEEEFADMCKRCNAAGVRIYVDAVINHMTSDWENPVGTAGSVAIPPYQEYPAVPYSYLDFNNPACTVTNYNNATQVRDCRLYGLYDLKQKSENVQKVIVTFMNKLIGLGVAGFRIDAAKHMWPEDLKIIYEKLDNLNVDQGFPENTKPFIYQEVIDLRNEPIKREEYTTLGMITEFMVGPELGNIFRGNKELYNLKEWDTGFGFVEQGDGLVFVDNHDNQRGHGAGGGSILTFKSPIPYKAAIAFLLAHPYGEPRIMSSFAFTNSEAGPPMSADEAIISPDPSNNILDRACGHGWVCEHRWKPIQQMVIFRNIVAGTELTDWQDDNENVIAFGRKDKGFIAFNNGMTDLDSHFQTSLPFGVYCDVISGGKVNNECEGNMILVQEDGKVHIKISGTSGERMVAIHAGAKVA